MTTSPVQQTAEVLNRMRGQHVLVVGDVLLDRYWWGTVTRISPEAPVPVVHKTRSSIAPGGAANVAANVASLGGVPHLVGLIGDDEPGRELRCALEQRGISTAGLVCDGQRPTTVKTRVVAHSQHVVRVDEEDTRPVNGALSAAVLAEVTRALADCEIAVVSDYAKGLLCDATLAPLFSAAGGLRRRVIVDPKGHEYGRYRGAYLLSPNRQEVLAAAGMGYNGPESIAQAASRIMAQVEPEALLVTEGEAGMSLFRRGDQRVHIPSVARKVFDVTGAGDTVIAALSLALSAGAPLLVACHLANAAAGLAVEQVGTAAITLE
jgi:rfaE bifunctional protein kinase chain/domain